MGRKRKVTESDLASYDLKENTSPTRKEQYERVIRISDGFIEVDGEKFMKVVDKILLRKNENFKKAFEIACNRYIGCVVEMLDIKGNVITID